MGLLTIRDFGIQANRFLQATVFLQVTFFEILNKDLFYLICFKCQYVNIAGIVKLAGNVI